jgi:hypothetical protein
MYYLDPSSCIIENSYISGSGWKLSDQNLINSSVVLATGATPGSPLAALSYKLNSTGAIVRQLFFFDGSGNLKETNTSSYNGSIGINWSKPQTISIGDEQAPSSNSAGLCACYDRDVMLGIRVYYGTYGSPGWVQEKMYQFNASAAGWSDGYQFNDADPDSGVGCATYHDWSTGNESLNLYYRNSSSGYVQQQYFDYHYPSDGWQVGSTSNWSIASGSDIAVCNDNEASEYVFYQTSAGGMIVRGIVPPTGVTWVDIGYVQDRSSGTKLAASFVDDGGNDGALLIFQNSSKTSTIWVNDLSRSNMSISNIAVP